MKHLAETWRDLYKQFELEAGLLVSVKSNEILNKTSNVIRAALKKDKKCCDFAVICVDGMLTSVNYGNLSNGESTILARG